MTFCRGRRRRRAGVKTTLSKWTTLFSPKKKRDSTMIAEK
jgi:hypothetical protein